VALTWDTADIQDNEAVCFMEAPADDAWHGLKKGDRILNPVTNALIWHSLNTGIGTITREVAAEVWARIHLVETIYGASLMNSEGERPITKDDVLKHIGLKTNASFKPETRASFLKRHATAFLEEQQRSFVRWAEEVESAA